MRTSELKEKGAIFFERIEEGFAKYQDKIVVLSEEEAFEHFRNLIDIYGEGNAFADFYYYKLPEEAQQKIDEALTEEELSYVRGLKVEDAEELVFPLERELLKVITKLNAKEVLFSTLYFVGNDEKRRSTWWGNYNREYYCFEDR